MAKKAYCHYCDERHSCVKRLVNYRDGEGNAEELFLADVCAECLWKVPNPV
jgi:hypothetical protein